MCVNDPLIGYNSFATVNGKLTIGNAGILHQGQAE